MEYRHELKYLISDIVMKELYFRFKPIMSLDKYHQDFYRIRSVYFDDMYDTCLNENLAGVDDRYKYRIRFYDDNLDYINLEKKYKKNGMTKKISERITQDKVNDLISFNKYNVDSLKYRIYSELICECMKSGMTPKCIVEYDRLAFVEPAGNVRITFDANIRGSRLVQWFLDTSVNYMIPVVESGYHILEIKYDEFLPKYILQLIDTNCLQRQSFSKYSMVRRVLG